MNHRSSAMTARRKTRFVVSSGRTGIGSAVGSSAGPERANFSCAGAKIEYVPVPVLCQSCEPIFYWQYEVKGHIPVRSMFSIVHDITDQVQILVLLVSLVRVGIRRSIPIVLDLEDYIGSARGADLDRAW